MQKSDIIRKVLKDNDGILRLIPNFVPRRFGNAGKRLRLHPDDYFPLFITVKVGIIFIVI